MGAPPERIERLSAGSVALLGVPWDVHSSFLRGAAEAPARIREALHSPASNLGTENGLDLDTDPRFLDVGDLPADEDAERFFERIETTVGALLARGARPVCLGGDHAVTPPILRAVRPRHPRLTVLHLDAHPDLYDAFDGNRRSHACGFARIMEAHLADRVLQVGIRTLNAHQRRQAERLGVEVLDMRQWHAGARPRLTDPVYLSVDLDVLDPAFAPGVSHREPGGLTTREVIALIQTVAPPLVGADIVELNPRRDPLQITAAAAAKLTKEIVGCMLAGPPADS